MRFTMYAQFNAMAVRDGFAAAADYAVGMGFSAVELLEFTRPGYTPLLPDRAAAADARRLLTERGLSAACYSVGAMLYHSPENERALMRHAEIAASLGSPYLHHTLLPWLKADDSRPDFSPAIEAAVEAAARVARYAAPLGLTCIYEDQGNYVNGVEGFGVFWREIRNRCANVGVCGDIGNSLFVDEGAEHFFAAYAGDICHVHIKDYLRKSAPIQPGAGWYRTKGGSWLRDTMVGHGVVDFDACMAILKRAGYSGTYALELDHPEPYEAGVRQAMDYLRRWG